MYDSLEEVLNALRYAQARDRTGKATIVVVTEILKEHPSDEVLLRWAKSIPAAIIKLGKSMNEVAESLGISRIRLWEIEKGQGASRDLVARICELLSIENPYS